MKRILITLSLLLPSLLCGAQEEIYVETRPGAEIFQISRKLEIPSDRRLHYDYSKDRKKKDKKGGRYLVTGLANRNRTPGYDTYIVSQKKKLFFVPMESVRDNAFIDRKNREISDAALMLSDSLESCRNAHQAAYDNLISLTEDSARRCQDRILGIRHKPDSILNLHLREVMDEDVRKYKIIRERYEEWTRTLPLDCQYAAGLVAVTGTGLTRSASGSCDYKLDFTNLSKKSIRNLVWTGKLLDKTGKELTPKALTGRFKGPCPPAWPASFVSKNIARNQEADRIDLSSIAITFTDGSKYEIDGAVLRTLLSMPKEALPAGVHTASHLEGLNQFEIDHNQLLQQKKKVFRSLLPEEEAIEKSFLGLWDALKIEVSRRGLSDAGMKDILTEERFQPLLKRSCLEESVGNYLETARTLERTDETLARFRKENFYE